MPGEIRLAHTTLRRYDPIMLQIEDVLRDRGSRYAVFGGPVQGRSSIEALGRFETREEIRQGHTCWLGLHPVRSRRGEE